MATTFNRGYSKEWSNWSGDVRFTPGKVSYPENENELIEAYGGRPHWGKKHNLEAARLKKLYPMWERFHEIRKEFDTYGIF